MRAAILAGAGLLLAAGPSPARTWSVRPDGSGDATSVQAGLDLAAAGDTVEVACGTYGEHDLVLTPGVALRSATGDPACVVIDAGQLGRVLSITGSGDPRTRLEGLTLRGGEVFTGGGGGIYLAANSAPTTIEDCAILGNRGFDYGGGILAEGSELVLVHCEIVGNLAANGGGVYCQSGEGLSLTDCDLQGNSAWVGGGGVACTATPIRVLAGSFRENRADHDGGAILASGSDLDLQDVEFLRNETVLAGAGGSLRLTNCTGQITRCVLVDGRAEGSGSGGALALWQSDLWVRETVFADCSATHGGTLWMYGASPSFEQCTFAFGGAEVQGTLLSSGHDSHPTFERTILAYASGFDPACVPVFCDEGSDVRLTCCDVFGNEGGDWVGCLAGQEGVDGNFSADPLFCALDDGDFTLQPDSPCAPPGATDCGLIGALPVGCGPVSVEEESWGRIKAGYRLSTP